MSTTPPATASLAGQGSPSDSGHSQGGAAAGDVEPDDERPLVVSRETRALIAAIDAHESAINGLRLFGRVFGTIGLLAVRYPEVMS